MTNFTRVFQPIPSWLNWPIVLNDQTYNNIDWQTLFTWLWRWLPLRLSKRQSPTTVLFRTTLTRTITQYELLWCIVVLLPQKRFLSDFEWIWVRSIMKNSQRRTQIHSKSLKNFADKIADIFSFQICIGNHTVSSSIWNQFARADFSFLKTSQVQINLKTVWLLINNANVKKLARKNCRKMFVQAIFSHFAPVLHFCIGVTLKLHCSCVL